MTDFLPSCARGLSASLIDDGQVNDRIRKGARAGDDKSNPDTDRVLFRDVGAWEDREVREGQRNGADI